MRMLLVSLTLVALALASGGCDKPEPAAELDAFDQAVDGGRSGSPGPVVWADRSILEDRPRRQGAPMAITPLVTSFTRPSAPAATPQPADPADGAAPVEGVAVEGAVSAAAVDEPAEVQQVRQAVGAMAGSVAAMGEQADLSVVVEAFVPEQAERIRRIVARFDGVRQGVKIGLRHRSAPAATPSGACAA